MAWSECEGPRCLRLWAGQRTGDGRMVDGEVPILETRPSSSALRLRKPDGLAAMQRAVGIMVVCSSRMNMRRKHEVRALNCIGQPG